MALKRGESAPLVWVYNLVYSIWRAISEPEAYENTHAQALNMD